MQCPVCSAELVMSERQGVEIDYCPKCRGVWLDRGELDKIIERSHQEQIPAPQNVPFPVTMNHPQYQKPYGDDRYRHKKRKSFLDDIFDF